MHTTLRCVPRPEIRRSVDSLPRKTRKDTSAKRYNADMFTSSELRDLTWILVPQVLNVACLFFINYCA